MTTQTVVMQEEEKICVGANKLPSSRMTRSHGVERLKSLAAMPELTEEHTNEIRELLRARLPDSVCDDEDLIAPVRAKLWSIMLLGLRPEDLHR